MDDFNIEQTLTGIGDDCEIVLLYKSIRFIIQLRRPDASHTCTIEGQLLRDLDLASEETDELVFDRCLENIHDVAISTCEATMRRLGTLQPTDTIALSLHDHLHPPTFLLQLVTVDGRPKCLQHDDSEMSRYKPSPSSLLSTPYMDTGLPFVEASDVQITKYLHFQKVIKVWWKKTSLVFKTAFPGEEQCLDREIRVLHAIEAARSSHSYLRIPRIRAIVVSQGRTVGFLEDLLDGCQPLSRINLPAMPISTRAKWRSQIQKTVETIHSLHLAWGDVKTENVLIDSRKDAWLVDFAGSFTNGWVDAEVKETVEGDLQGLGRIMAFLDVHTN